MSNATDRVKELEAQTREARKQQLFCVYYSPGTLYPETTRVEVERRDLPACAAGGREVTERHGAKPFAFRFEDGNGSHLSGLHYLTGKVLTRDDVPDDDKHRIMRANMNEPERCVVVENINSYRHTVEFYEHDVIVDWDGVVVRRGSDADLVAYRAKFKPQG